MLQNLLQTDSSFVLAFIRVVSGIIIFPYGMHKLLGGFQNFGDGKGGVRSSIMGLKDKKVPLAVAWLVILGQSIGSVALIIGFFGRVAALGNFLIFTGALIVHISDGWTLNWFGKKNGEGIEYFVLLLSLLLITMVKGSGSFSLDILISEFFFRPESTG